MSKISFSPLPCLNFYYLIFVLLLIYAKHGWMEGIGCRQRQLAAEIYKQPASRFLPQPWAAARKSLFPHKIQPAWPCPLYNYNAWHFSPQQSAWITTEKNQTMLRHKLIFFLCSQPIARGYKMLLKLNKLIWDSDCLCLVSHNDFISLLKHRKKCKSMNSASHI